MGKTTFELINELIIAISYVLWPISLFVVLLVFRKQLIELLTRLKKGKIGGQEFEFSEKIDKFEKNVKEIEQEIPERVWQAGGKLIKLGYDKYLIKDTEWN